MKNFEYSSLVVLIGLLLAHIILFIQLIIGSYAIIPLVIYLLFLIGLSLFFIVLYLNQNPEKLHLLAQKFKNFNLTKATLFALTGSIIELIYLVVFYIIILVKGWHTYHFVFITNIIFFAGLVLFFLALFAKQRPNIKSELIEIVRNLSLKTVTLLALIGSIISFVGLFSMIVWGFSQKTGTVNFMSFLIGLLPTIVLIIFFSSLYTKQKQIKFFDTFFNVTPETENKLLRIEILLYFIFFIFFLSHVIIPRAIVEVGPVIVVMYVIFDILFLIGLIKISKKLHFDKDNKI